MPVLSDPFASLFSSTAEFARLEEGLSGPGVTALFGLPPAGRMALAVQLSRRLGRPLCVVTAGEAEASRAAADLKCQFTGEVLARDAADTISTKQFTHSRQILSYWLIQFG